MAEWLRDVQVRVTVDTNKRTVEQTFSGDSIDECLDAAGEYFDGFFD